MSKSQSSKDQEQGFLGHLYELRDRLLRIVLAVGIIFLCLVPFAQSIYEFTAAPLTRHVPELIAITVIGPFLVPYKLALLLAFVLALPFVLYQIWGFVAPGLYQHEKRLAMPVILSSVLLFYLGMAFVYFVVLPMVFSVIPQFAPNLVDVKPDLGEYLDFVMLMFIAFGLGFEVPVATVLLINSGVVTREDLAKKRPYVIVVAFIVGMLMTPPDVISQVLLAVPVWLLFELGLVASGLFGKLIRQSQAERDAMDDPEYQATAPHASTQAGDATEELDAELDQAIAEQDALDEQGRYAAGTEDEQATDTDKDNTDGKKHE